MVFGLRWRPAFGVFYNFLFGSFYEGNKTTRRSISIKPSTDQPRNRVVVRGEALIGPPPTPPLSATEPVFLNIYGAQESIPRIEFSQPM
jgi:hypothetical protein